MVEYFLSHTEAFYFHSTTPVNSSSISYATKFFLRQSLLMPNLEVICLGFPLNSFRASGLMLFIFVLDKKNYLLSFVYNGYPVSPGAFVDKSIFIPVCFRQLCQQIGCSFVGFFLSLYFLLLITLICISVLCYYCAVLKTVAF